EGDAEGQVDGGQVDRAEPGGSQERVQVIDQEIRVLEHHEERQVGGDGEGQDQTRAAAPVEPFEQQAEGVVDEDAGQQDADVGALTPEVKAQAGDQQNEVAEFTPHQKIRPQHQREKQKQEDRRAKDHGSPGKQAGLRLRVP